jgi:hypothetical protein
LPAHDEDAAAIDPCLLTFTTALSLPRFCRRPGTLPKNGEDGPAFVLLKCMTVA